MEPPSPTSSTCSSRSSASCAFSALPITGLRQKIVEKILENRVTLIVGETGCGKSSQVPQFLLDANIKPILCTQPRRFAVVAVAKMVAKARKCVVGEEVGYHIGHSKHLSPSSKIVFKTAGVLLDEMREKGMNALNYKAIILDEVHERSVESDLVLVCIKQLLLKSNNLRVVLMSATADIGRYKEYFGDIGRDERVEVIGIPSSSQHSFFERKVLYLEQVASFLGRSLDSLSSDCCPGEQPSKAVTDIKPEMHKIIHDLIIHIHDNEADIEKGILVFLPTYRSLEQQWFLLKPFSSLLKVHILHSSIDTNQALDAMKICKSHRKIILATNIAESSVTIPKVAYVIDSCRSLEVYWDSERKAESAELVWISKSQAEQRRGRTGRTCDGLVYRLVTGSFFNKLQDHERPSILRLSLRQQVLNICCAESKAINDPKVLLQKALDPPEPDVIEDALHLLVQMNALEKVSSRRYEPTYYGRLLSSFSLGFDACVIIVKFGIVGMLHEGILLGILRDMQPLPILHPFGEENLFREYIESYYRGSTNNINPLGQNELVYMGNLCAFKFWQRVFKDKHRIGHLKEVLKSDEIGATEGENPNVEKEWCFFHNLLQSSLHQASEIYGDVLNSLHRFRPYFLGPTDGFPSYYYPHEYKHTCTIKCQLLEETEAQPVDDEQPRPSSDIEKCVGPFVSPDHFQTSHIASELSLIVKEIRAIYLGIPPGTQPQPSNVINNNGNAVYGGAPSCVYFLKGSCTRGSSCIFSHSAQANKPSCKFFFSLKGCRNGNGCPFSHDMGPTSPSSGPTNLCIPEEYSANPMSLLQLFPGSCDGSILILDDTDLHFTTNIASFFDPSQIVATTSRLEFDIFDPKLSDVRILWGLNHPYQPMICKTAGSLVPWGEITTILWFPNLESPIREVDAETKHFRTFFEYLSIRSIADGLHRVRLILTMNNVIFSQLQMEEIARESFFFLAESFPFDDASFGEISCNVVTRKAGWVSRPISYVFALHPPSDVQFGNYVAAIQKSLRDVIS